MTKKNILLNSKKFINDPVAKSLIPVEIAKKFKVIPLFHIDNTLMVGMLEPDNINTIDELANLTSFEITPVPINPDRFENMLKETYGVIRKRDVIELRGDIVGILNNIIQDGIISSASDIHLEQKTEKIQVRFRIDGELINVFTYSSEYHEEIISRLKVISGLDIAEKRLPQEGKIVWNFGDKKIDLRLVIFPCIYGEDAVIRILDPENIKKRLDELGFDKEFLSLYREYIQKKQGMILICGPTGSGKTTTLYTTLGELDLDAYKVFTIEDPCEYQEKRVVQLEVNNDIGFDYKEGLKAILRADPDIIMVGEIRDLETAEIAIRAALTGHLVFSTLHSTRAIAAIDRLYEMGIKRYLISDSIIAVVTQRLVRTLCPYCKEYKEFDATDKEICKKLGYILNGGFFPVGCSQCNNKGYLGRTLIYEGLFITQDIRKDIISEKTFDALKKTHTFISLEKSIEKAIKKGKIYFKDALQFLIDR